ncbi:hypothetical protein JAAARDRAFT_157264 [Jaapia argillacea MUCL 33604]|uniref:Ubiquinone biosynthesis protein n=1 Tax=Jaapia argillacea MUCL 33604 TaxID=933084 RepID=A0A067PTG0_9AGAM|nr:hypothetical protein JAAARDRAFT_157264 [Jaapia argillacea MUCL 33604]
MRSQLLKSALPLIKDHGFTRQALSLSALSLPQPHKEPLSDSAVSALFGIGDDARRTLVEAWLDNAREEMVFGVAPNVREILRARLKCNEPVLGYLPEVFALLALPSRGLPPLDLRPALRHSFKIADDACHASGDSTVGTSWYARRISLAGVYTATELHQLTSPKTAYNFLDSLLESSSSLKASLDNGFDFANYVGRSWGGIIRSSGIL